MVEVNTVWTKDSDWIPISNAQAQVEFWKDDLIRAERALEKIETFRKYDLPNFEQMRKYASKGVEVSKVELAKAEKKLESMLLLIEATNEP